MIAPYLSIIVTTRNDDEESVRRTQRFIDNIGRQARLFSLNTEIIIVEWNPPQSNKKLQEVLTNRCKNTCCDARIITVGNEIHKTFPNSDEIQLFQMIAKNVGIRRATGSFVLATNIDIILSNDLYKEISRHRLKKNRMYRVDRYDVDRGVLDVGPLDEQLVFCENNIIGAYLRNQTIKDGDRCIRSYNHGFLSRRNALFSRNKKLHTNACGDFTLMSKDKWFSLKGYPELPLRAFKIDGLLCYKAHYSGVREKLIGYPNIVFHIDHPARNDGMDSALTDLKEKGVHSVSMSTNEYNRIVNLIKENRYDYNPDGWGLEQYRLPEVLLV